MSDELSRSISSSKLVQASQLRWFPIRVSNPKQVDFLYRSYYYYCTALKRQGPGPVLPTVSQHHTLNSQSTAPALYQPLPCLPDPWVLIATSTAPAQS